MAVDFTSMQERQVSPSLPDGHDVKLSFTSPMAALSMPASSH